MAEGRHIESLDGLRGFAAAIVVISHVDDMPIVGDLSVLRVGAYGVAIFFALSGFLMAYLYGGRPLTRESASDYLVSRFSRIYPVYFVAICLSAVLSAIPNLHYPDHMIGAFSILRHVAMLGSNGVFWSIPPEIQFYIFFLALWLCFQSPQKYVVLAVGIVCLLAVLALFGFPGPGILLTSKLPYFLFGALAGRLMALRPMLHPPVAVGIAALAMLAIFIPSRALGILSQTSFWGLHSALIGALIVYLIACEHPITVRVFANAPLRFLGRISFSLYLFHVPVLFFFDHLLVGLLPVWVIVMLAVIASVLFAWLSNIAIETPARQYLVSLWKRRKAPAAKLAAFKAT
jgi:peptidoglycan/LPS O-acetylase OafA/YrhL